MVILMKTSQNLDRAIKKDRTVFTSSAQVYNGNDLQNVTEIVRSPNIDCTKSANDAGTGKERPEKTCRNRAPRRVTQVPPDELLALLNKHFLYDLKRGRMVHRKTRKIASKKSYHQAGFRRVISFCGITIMEHRAVWMYVRGVYLPSTQEIDHINRDATDNHITNLRLVTHAQNQWNAGIRKDNTTGLKGVTEYRGKRGVSYSANISINGKVKYLGAFPTALAASEAYQAKALELRGEYAPHTIPERREK